MAATVGLLGVWAMGLAGSAQAALPSNCSQSGSSVTCTFSYTGAAQLFTVPADVTSIVVDARGGAGGASGLSAVVAGGMGARVQGTVAVTAGEALQVNVGGQGDNEAGGWNGGGSGANGLCCGVGLAGGGGGASDLRHGTDTLGERLLVAAGGGGTGATGLSGLVAFPGGTGGAGGGSGSNGTAGKAPAGVDATGGGPGLAGGLMSGGTGGSGGDPGDNNAGGGTGGLGVGGNWASAVTAA